MEESKIKYKVLKKIDRKKEIELILSLLIISSGCAVAILNLVVNKFTMFELGTTLILVGLSFYVARGGIETDVVAGLKNRELEKEIEALKSQKNEAV